MNGFDPPPQHPGAPVAFPHDGQMQPQMQHPGPPQRIAAPPPPVPSRENKRPWLTSAIIRDLVQAFALLIAAMWGGYTFIYKEIVVPSRQPAALVVTPTLEAIGRHGDTILAKATFHMANRSDSKVYSPAVWYSIRGLKLQPVATEDTTYLRENRENANKPFPTARFSQFTAADVIAVGKVQAEVETWFEPGSEQRIEHILYIPADRYDAAQLGVSALVTKSIDDVQSIRWQVTDNGDLEPSLVFRSGSKYGTAGNAPAALAENSPRYLSWLRDHQAGVNFVTATISLWRGSASATAPAAAPASTPTP